jgi:serine/threonine protein phosphatase PrpC
MTDARAAARSDAGKVRGNNEDRWLVRDQRGVLLLAVADGVGGEAGGERASAAAVDALADRFYSALATQDLRSSLGTALREANDAVVRGAGERGDRSATTLVVAAVRGGEATIANVGDSRAYLVRKRRARQVTTDHSGTGEHEITRFVGDERGVQPDVFVETLRAGDRLVLCSDGLTRHVPDEEIALRAARAEPWRAADELVELANSRGGEDNITVVVYKARRSPLARALVATTLLALLVLVTVVGAALATARPAF